MKMFDLSRVSFVIREDSSSHSSTYVCMHACLCRGPLEGMSTWHGQSDINFSPRNVNWVVLGETNSNGWGQESALELTPYGNICIIGYGWMDGWMEGGREGYFLLVQTGAFLLSPSESLLSSRSPICVPYFGHPCSVSVPATSSPLSLPPMI